MIPAASKLLVLGHFGLKRDARIKPSIIIHSASADMPEDRFIKLKIILKHSRML